MSEPATGPETEGPGTPAPPDTPAGGSATDSDPGSGDASDDRLEAWVRADRLAGLGTLVASVAHEINNPITYVLGNLSELERATRALREAVAGYRETLRAVLGDEAEPLIESAESKLCELVSGDDAMDELLCDSREGALRVRDLVRELLVTARGEAAMERFDLHALLDFTLRMTRHQARTCATVECEYAASSTIHTDRGRLGQVVLNLVRNALEASQPPDPERHRIVVRTRDTERGVRIEIEDSGVGVPPELGERIFAPFVSTRTDRGGTGLGLHVSRALIAQLGGVLDFHPAPCQGTVFTIELPVEAPTRSK